MPAHKIFLVAFITTNFYGTIQFFGQMNPVAYAMFPLLTISGLFFARVGYSYGGILIEASERFRQSWRRRADQMPNYDPRVALQIRQLDSCRDLMINCGSFYYFDKTTFTTFMAIVVDNTIALLVSF
jgi:hypothetical protein